MTKPAADFLKTPHGFSQRAYRIPYFYFVLRIGSWKLDNWGLWRFVSFTAAKPMKNGFYAKRDGWTPILKFSNKPK